MTNATHAKKMLVAALLASTAFAGTAMAQDLPVIRFQAVAGSIGAIPLLIVQNANLDEKYGFDGVFDYLSIDGGFQSFLVGNYEVSVDNDIIGLAAVRNEGFDVTGFYPNGFLYLGIVVPGDSTAQTPEDLRGLRVGHFGMESGTTSFLKVAIQKLYGFDLTTEFDLQQVGPAALVPMLESGDIEAMLNFEPYVSTAMLSTDGRYLAQATQLYKEVYDGFSPWIGTWAAHTDWLMANPELAYAIVDALEEANNMIIDSNYEILREPYIAEALGIASPEVLEQLIENGNEYGYFTTEWTPELMEKAQAYLTELADQDIIITEAPDGVVTTLEQLLGPRPE